MAGGQRSGGRVSPELAAVGERLRQARQSAGHSVDDIEGVTRIRAAYLEAIEVGRRGDLPGDVFIKGFVRAYANAVGLDGDRVVAQYKRSLERTAPDPRQGDLPLVPPPAAPRPVPARAPTDRPAESARRVRTRRPDRERARRAARHERTDAIRAARARVRARRLGGPSRLRRWVGTPRALRWGRWLLGALAILVVGWASYALAGHFAGSGHPGKRTAPALTAKASVRSTTTPPGSTGSKQPLAVTAPKTSSGVRVRFVHLLTGWHGTYVVPSVAGGLVVRIATDRRCWTDRWVDGSTGGQPVTLPAGGTTTWKARQSLLVEVARAPAVRSLTVNGQPTPSLPPEGTHVEWLTFRLAAASAG